MSNALVFEGGGSWKPLRHVKTRKEGWAWVCKPAASWFGVVEGPWQSKTPSATSKRERGRGRGPTSLPFRDLMWWRGGRSRNPLRHVETRKEAWAWAYKPAVSPFDAVEGWWESKTPSVTSKRERRHGRWHVGIETIGRGVKHWGSITMNCLIKI